jgi:hypothetical protein
MFKKENFPLIALILSFFILGVLSRFAQDPDAGIPFLMRLMLAEFGFFLALSGSIYAWSMGKKQGYNAKIVIIGLGCLIPAILLTLMGFDFWQQLQGTR